MKIRILTLAYVLALVPIIGHAQILQQVQNALQASQHVFKEKIFLHTSKEHYLSGELLWFKVYAVDASTLLPSDLSKVAYIDVLNQENQSILQAKVAVQNGSGNGYFTIPFTLKTGSYKIRAYTNWMKNFGADYFFEKPLTLINSLVGTENLLNQKASQDIQFFPEGGDLVEGLMATVGFKAIDQNGKGIAVNGIIINQKNDTVTRFQTFKFGMGKFTFTPLANDTYKAIVYTNTNEVLTKALPIVKKQGSMLSLKAELNDLLSLNITTNTGAKKMYLLAHNGKKVSFAEEINILNGKANSQINKLKLPEGISHFTLFNENGSAVAERLYFKKPSKQLILAVEGNLTSYKTRSPVSIMIDATNENQQGVEAETSISVRRLDSLQGIDQSDILSYFWLSSELKGTIESPRYYFLDNKESDIALDHLLLTQGWRRINSKETRANLTFLPELDGHIITGKIKSDKPNPFIYLTIPTAIQQFYNTIADSTGNFIVNTKDFYGLNEIIIQTNLNKDTTAKITINSSFSEDYTPANLPNFMLKSSALSDLQNHSINMQVQQLYASNISKVFRPLNVDTTRFYGLPYKSYKLDNYTRFDLMEDVLREYVTEVFVSKSQKHFQLKVLSSKEFLGGEPLVLLDGAPYFDMDKVMEINPKKIKQLDVIRDSYIYGPSMFNGILNFVSYKPNLASLEINPNAVVLDYEGMQLQREFYSPSYTTPEEINSRRPDFRNQLFWSPSTNLDEKGKAKFNFYTSDQTGVYIGIINGLSKTGIPGTRTFTFEVKP